ncbi:hypothetical protein Y032_0041g410 [Ancylostoma ceylanicum]|uniref:Secreted protein n=1 Tax=Ancylostoma ceylanicum TaxID=53326 RepID=A0A016UH27_9BILA|nr:hypothetical protein Y032_0041g410 [Ancylostoma ceylanicum]
MVVLSLTFLVQTMRTDVWSSGYPDSTCADLPRITAGMYRTGYIDLPAIARRPLICVADTRSVRALCNDRLSSPPQSLWYSH